MSLLRSTNDLLSRQKKTGKSLAEIHRALGGKVEREWFYKFAAGDIPDPSVNRVQTLHDGLEKIEAQSA